MSSKFNKYKLTEWQNGQLQSQNLQVSRQRYTERSVDVAEDSNSQGQQTISETDRKLVKNKIKNHGGGKKDSINSTLKR